MYNYNCIYIKWVKVELALKQMKTWHEQNRLSKGEPHPSKLKINGQHY